MLLRIFPPYPHRSQMRFMLVLMPGLGCLLALWLWAAAEHPSRVWETRGFDAFRSGEFDAGGSNLYVSRSGTVQTVHRWDVNRDGFFDLIFNNTHDLVYTPPAFQ